jgi:type IV secretory pathway VirB10-like protein
MFLALLFAASAANAQMYRWVDKDGKVRYGDTPPPGAKTSSIKGPQSGAAPAPAAAAKDAKDAKKGPLTPAEQEQEYRKRQAESRKEAEKADAERQAKSDQGEACNRTREYLRTLQSGQRVARTNASGERYYMNEDQVAQEIAKAQQAEQKACK